MNIRTLLLTLLCLGVAMPADARRARNGNYWSNSGAAYTAPNKHNDCDPCKPKPCPDPCKPDPCYDPCPEEPCYDNNEYDDCDYDDCDYDDCDDEHDYNDCDYDDCDYDDCDEDPCHKDTCKEICVTSCDDSGCGTLRWAIEQACTEEMCKTNGGANIVFHLDKCDPCYDCVNHVWQIKLKTPIEIPCPVCIDGYSQCGARQNSMLTVRENTAKIKIEIKRDDMVRDGCFDGFRFLEGSEGSVLKGLAIGGFLGESCAAVRLLANNIQIAGSYLSLRADGVTPCQNTIDVMAPSDNNLIGGDSVCDAVLFAGNGFAPIDEAASQVVLEKLGAITVRGKNNVLRNVSGGIDRSGKLAINPNALIGVLVSAPVHEIKQELEIYNLSMKNSAVAGYAENIYSGKFDGIKLESVSVGTTRQQDAVIGGLPNGNGVTVYYQTPAPMDPYPMMRGTFKFIKGVVSGTLTPLNIGGVDIVPTSPLVCAVLDQVLVGTNGPATTNPGTLKLGNASSAKATLTTKLDVLHSIFSASMSGGFVLETGNQMTKFYNSAFGSGRTRMETNLGNGGVGLDLRTSNGPVEVDKSFGKYNVGCDIQIDTAPATVTDSTFFVECVI